MLKHLKNTEGWEEKSLAEQGFTLIELLVVIAILGILAVVGVLAFNGFTDDAESAVNKTELAEVKTAANAFKATHNGTAPTALSDLDQYLDTVQCTYDFTTDPVTQTSCP